jgi:hypothetical protein
MAYSTEVFVNRREGDTGKLVAAAGPGEYIPLPNVDDFINCKDIDRDPDTEHMRLYEVVSRRLTYTFSKERGEQCTVTLTVADC